MIGSPTGVDGKETACEPRLPLLHFYLKVEKNNYLYF